MKKKFFYFLDIISLEIFWVKICLYFFSFCPFSMPILSGKKLGCPFNLNGVQSKYILNGEFCIDASINAENKQLFKKYICLYLENKVNLLFDLAVETQT